MELNTLPRVFRATARRLGSRVALRQKKLGLWKDITWETYYQQARQLAQGLLEAGLQKGDRVAIIGDNCLEWVLVDLGTQLAGGVSVGIYATNAWPQVAHIIQHAECRFLFAQNEEQVDKWLHFRAETPQLERVIYWEEKGLQNLVDPLLLSFAAWMETGRQAETRQAERLDLAMEAVQPDDLAMMIYTSGTTGQPKGAMLSQANLIWMGQAVPKIDPGFTIRPTDEVMSFLPLCHIFERLFSVIVHVSLGYVVSFVERPDTVPQNLREISPTLGYAVPRVWEKYHANIQLRMEEASWVKRHLYRAALAIGQAHTRYILRHQLAPLWLRGLYALARMGVFHWLKLRLGLERMRFAFSGAAPISPEVLRFFYAIDLPMVEGYGQTEGTGISSASRVRDFRLGTVGKVVPEGELKLATDGEILLRSPGVFMGYYRDPDATDRALQNGWLYSGDLGEIDEDGYLRIIGRKKDLIITAGGKNIAPQAIENQLKFSPYIHDAIAIGDRRKFISALIVLEEEHVVKYAQDHHISFATYADLAAHPEVYRLIEQEVQHVNQKLARVENVRKFVILNKKLYEEDGEVTPTMKVKRAIILARYQELIEGMYREKAR